MNFISNIAGLFSLIFLLLKILCFKVINSVREKLSLHKKQTIHLELASMTNRAFLLDLFNMLAV